MQKNNIPRRARFYLPIIISLVTIGLSVPLQANETPQLNSEQSATKYGAVAYFCDQKGNTPPSDTCGIGYSNNHASREAAHQHVLQKCGVSGCKVIAELTNACGVLAEVSDIWQYKGETLGYRWRAWSDQDDALKYPSLLDLEKVVLAFCDSFAQKKSGHMPGYTFKPCHIVESSCPTPVLSSEQ